ncbi:MAG: hypothetical protein JWO17_501 [Actinomycetia bacterium]|nr:hypothetical protein [Actinomycetes bacterium]
MGTQRQLQARSVGKSLAFGLLLFLATFGLGGTSSAGLARSLSTVFTVDSTDDTVDVAPGNGMCADAVGACTLRAAIQEADATAGAVQITVPAGTYSLTIANPSTPFGVIPTIANEPATGDLDVSGQVTIAGAGVGQSVVSAEYLDRVFQIVAGANVVLQGLTIQHGQPFDCAGGVGVYNGGTLDLERVDVFSNVGSCGTGGGIYNAGTLTANATTIDGNGVSNSGGGIFNAGIATFSAATFSSNSVVFGGGGGITNAGSLTLTDVTLSGNGATSSNGGALKLIGGSAALQDVTIVSNGAGGSGGGGALRFDGGTATVKNTVLAYNSGGNCRNGTPTSLGHNIADLADCTLTSAGDVSSTDPLAAALADNGGPVQTAALQAGSPAIDAGAGCAATDARGVARPQGPACDIGAFEAVPPPPTLALTVTVDGSGTASSNPAGISCPSTCSAGFTSGTSVTLTATPAAGSNFSGWSGACSGTGGCAVSITAATAVAAHFTAEPPSSTPSGPATTLPAAEKPTPQITVTPAAPITRESVQFSAAMTDGGGAVYSWNFDDGSRAEGPRVRHAYREAGTYLVTLTATTSSGTTGTTQASVIVAGSTPSGPGRVFGGRVTLLSPFGPGEPDPGLPAPAGLQVRFAAGSTTFTPTTTTSGGLYQRTQLPTSFKPDSVYVTNNAGTLLGQSNYIRGVLLVPHDWGNPGIAVQDLAIVPDPHSFVVSGRVLPPATPPTTTVVVTVSVEAYNTNGTLIASGNVHSTGYGDYRVEATPTPAFTPSSTTASMHVNRLVIKLTENGTVTDTTDTLQEITGTDGRNLPTRDLHG